VSLNNPTSNNSFQGTVYLSRQFLMTLHEDQLVLFHKSIFSDIDLWRKRNRHDTFLSGVFIFSIHVLLPSWHTSAALMFNYCR